MKKQEQITEMFNKIEPSYDFLNHFMSFGIDNKWRKRAISYLKEIKKPVLLDVATGTGRMVSEMIKLKPVSIYAIDPSIYMLNSMIMRLKRRNKFDDFLFPSINEAEKLPFKNNFFSAVTVAFGVRNFQNLEVGLKEIFRVTKPGGLVIILELTMPSNSYIRKIYKFYLSKIVPFWGGLISRNRQAYKYLSDSIQKFPDGAEFEKILSHSGLRPLKCIRMTFGIATIYVAEKPLQ